VRNLCQARLFVLCLVVVCVAPGAWGQTAQIIGTVTDSTGARVQGASITASNADTGAARTTMSADSGYYTIPLLTPGNYRVSVSKDGFKPISITNLTLGVGNNIVKDFALEVGAVSQAVTVNGGVELVDTQSGTIKRVVEEQRIVDLPLNGRDVTELLAIQAGVLQTTSNGPGNGFVVNGSRQTGVSYSLDGGLNTNSYQNFSGGFPNPDAIEEFSVQTNNFSAEYGNAVGAVVSAITKSGTNQFHGSAFEFIRNGVFDARDYFAASRDSLKRNQFGGTFGGPILRKRLYFFFSYQDTATRSNPQTEIQTLPSANMRLGDFSGVSNQIYDPVTGNPYPHNQIPVTQFSSVAEAFLKYLPTPASTDGTFITGYPIISNQPEYTGRVDWDLGKNRLTGRIYYTEFKQPFTGDLSNYASMYQSGPGKSTQPITQITLNDVWTVSPSFLNSLTLAGIASQQFNDWSSVTLPLDYQQAGVQNIAVKKPSSVYLSVSGEFTARPGWQYDLHEKDLQVADTATWVHGKNELKFGMETIRTTNNIQNDFTTMGQFTFNGSATSNINDPNSGSALADFMLGAADSFAQGGGEYKDNTQFKNGFFVQDNMRASEKLTLNAGIRWDPMTTPHDSLGRVECYEPGMQSTRFPNAPLGYLLAGDKGCPDGGYNNFMPVVAPRLGFAQTIRANTVIRGGFGLFFTPIAQIDSNNFVDSAPFSPQVSLNGVNFENPYANAVNPFPAGYAPFTPPRNVAFELPLGEFGAFTPNFRPAYMESFNLTIEHTLARNTALRASYIGNNGRHLSITQALNNAVYVPGGSSENNIQARRLNQDYSQILNAESEGFSSYNALQLSIERRSTHNFSFEVNYTYSKSIDNQSTESTPGQGTPIIPNQPSLNTGPSDFDIKHRLLASYVWYLPKLTKHAVWMREAIGGWELTGIWTLQGGMPFTVFDGKDNSFTGLGIDHANQIGNPHLDTGRGSSSLAAEYFDTAAFAPNGLGTFGNAPRNSIYGPGLVNTDMGLMKYFAVRDTTKLQFRSEFFNALNHTNFQNPVSDLNSSQFGQITSANPNRILQLALKLLF
jgi:Carboxypeptidase regulatory-like domain/TonB-dependent Receptor Plug Domain/TonB dependent receptor